MSHFDQDELHYMIEHAWDVFKAAKQIKARQVLSHQQHGDDDVLPRSLLLHILSFLPIITLHDLRVVCHKWNLYTVKTLVDMHRKQIPQTYYLLSNKDHHTTSEVRIFEPSNDLLNNMNFHSSHVLWHCENVSHMLEDMLAMLKGAQDIKEKILSILSLTRKGIRVDMDDRVFECGSVWFRRRLHRIWLIRSHGGAHFCIDFRGYLEAYD